MRIAHVVRQYLPSVGGLEEVVRNLVAQQLQGGQHQPEIFTLNKVFRTGGAVLPAHEQLDGVPVHRFGFAGSERYPLCPQVVRALGQADVVHVHGIDFFFDYLALLRFWLRKPLLVSTHGGFFHTAYASRLKRVYFQTVTRLSARAYQQVIATSDNDGDLFRPVVRAGHLTVIENGVDVEKFRGAAAPVLGPVLLYFGRWSVNKGLLECIDLLAALRAAPGAVPWTLMIAGREYDLNAAALTDYARSRGVQASVRLYPNPGVDDLRALIGQASYFLCLSHHEGFGIAPIEAISAGLVPVLSDIPPFAKLHAHTGLGLLLTETASAEQAQRVNWLHAQMLAGVHTVRPSAQAMHQAVQRYSWAGVAAHYAHAYASAVEVA
jgi:alpha-1,3-mannosyltransferase